MKKYIINTLVMAGVLLGVSSCNGFLDKTPTDQVVASTAMVTLYDAGVAVNGMYTQLKTYTLYARYVVEMGDMRADNLYPRELNGTSSTVYTLDYESEANTYFGLWNTYYNVIMRANTIIKNIGTIKTSSSSQDAERDDYLGQAYAIRAFCYFDLARLYGYPYLKDNGASLGAVLITEPVAAAEAKLPRSTVAQTYDLIQSDLENAKKLLSREKNNGHFNYWAAELLNARVCLYKGDYSNAYTMADDVIKNSPYSLVSNAEYINYWGKECGDESVLELLVSTEGDIDSDGGFYGLYHNLWFDDLNAGSGIIPTLKWRSLFKDTPNDVRAKFIAYDDPTTGVKKTGKYWLKKFIGNKDRGFTFRRNNPRILRMSEAYLIAAEAGLEIGNKVMANTYLNAVRKRADLTATDVVATLDLIQTERQKEFIGEGHRFFDIMRRGGTITRDMTKDPSDYAGTSSYQASFDWSYFKVVLPISHSERLTYTNLQQNPGYKE